MMWGRLGFVMLVVLTLGACASGGTSSRSVSNSVLSRSELDGVSELNAYEAVMRLRPQWLTTHGRVSFNSQQGVRLYVDGVLRGYVADLVGIRANAVQSMRFLTGREATARYGTDHGDGAVLVTSR